MKVILASASPRRQELLKKIFADFTIMKSQSKEQAIFSTPAQYVMDLATEKALDVAGQLSASLQKTCSEPEIHSENLLIIGADTIVFHNGRILGKPSDAKEAFFMLKSLSGNTHEVYTGVALLTIMSGKIATHSFYCRTEVCINAISDEELYAYIGTGDVCDQIGTGIGNGQSTPKTPCNKEAEWSDKAGGYAIQGTFAKYIKEIHGDYYNVVGLPVSKLYEEIKKLGFCL